MCRASRSVSTEDLRHFKRWGGDGTYRDCTASAVSLETAVFSLGILYKPKNLNLTSILKVSGNKVFHQILSSHDICLARKLFRLCVVSGFPYDVHEMRALLEYSAAWSGNSVPRFPDNLSVPSSRVNSWSRDRLGQVTLGDWTDRSSGKVGRKSSFRAAEYSRKSVYLILFRLTHSSTCLGKLQKSILLIF